MWFRRGKRGIWSLVGPCVRRASQKFPGAPISRLSLFVHRAMVLLSDRAEPPRKRVKSTVNSAEASSSKSKPRQKLFAPFRALGLITNHVPFALQLRSYKGATDGPRIHILTCLGRSWALWEGGRMSLLFVSAFYWRSPNLDLLLMRCTLPRSRRTCRHIMLSYGQ